MIGIPEKIKISVLICTFNRAALLNRLLISLEKQTLDHEFWEIIVIDNNSRDETKTIIEEWQNTLQIIYIKELKQGLSFARNRGIHQSNSDYLLYLDDDVWAEPGLLQSYYDNIYALDMSKIACLGGKILVEWEGGNKPSWFPEKFEGLYGHYDYGPDVIDVSYALGGNMLWRKDALLRFGGFDGNLGRKGNSKLASEETTLLRRALDAGLKIKYIPNAVVRHWTPYSRQRRKYLFEVCYWLGISKSIAETNNAKLNATKNSFIQNLKLFRNLQIYIANYLFYSIKRINFLSNSESVYWLGMVLFAAGDLIQKFFSLIK